mgnify:CR=1 FL=1
MDLISARRLREHKNTPIIMVSAKKDDIDKIRGSWSWVPMTI